MIEVRMHLVDILIPKAYPTYWSCIYNDVHRCGMFPKPQHPAHTALRHAMFKTYPRGFPKTPKTPYHAAKS